MALARLGAGHGHPECGALVVSERLRHRAGPNVVERRFADGQGLALVVFIHASPAVAAPGLVVADPGFVRNLVCGGLGRA